MSTKVKIRKPYDKTERLALNFPKPTMAKQSFKDECNINTIMAKYQNTGLIDHVAKVQGAYGDFTSVQDYQLSLNQVIAAQDAFDELPSAVRKRFANNPSELMAFLSDKENHDEAVKLGLIPKPSAPPPAAPTEPSEKATPATKEATPPAA